MSACEASMDQNQLKELWNSGRPGRLCPKEQLKALAFREVYKSMGQKLNVNKITGGLKTIKKTGGDGHPPTYQALQYLYGRVDSDKDWFPGKSYQTKRGPDPVLTPAKKRCIANSAMAVKSSGGLGF